MALRSTEEGEQSNREASLTASGRKKCAQDSSCELVPGVDYVVKDRGGDDWVALENVPAMATLRHQWILRRRRRPEAPHFKGCPLPKHKPGSAEQNARITMAYFHPWTLRPGWGDFHVPCAHKLKGDREAWKDALTHWLDGNILCAESQRSAGGCDKVCSFIELIVRVL